MLRLLEDKIATPLGPLWVIADEAFNLRAVEWEEHSDRMVEAAQHPLSRRGLRAYYCP